MAGSSPVVQQIVRTYNRIPVAINPGRTRTPTTIWGAVGKAVNPLNPMNAAMGLAGITLPGVPTSIPDLLLSLQGSSPQTDDPYANWKALRYKSREDMINRVGQQMVREAALPGQPVTPPPATGLRLAAPAEPAFRPPTPARTSYVGPPAPAVRASAPSAQRSPQPAPVAQPTSSQAAQVTAPVQTPAPEMSPLAKEYAQQQRIAELLGAEEMVRRLNAARPMTTVSDEDMLTWADANPALAYREMLRRESLAN